MEQTEEQTLFDSKLNETGKKYIRKFAAATRTLLLFGILLSLVFLATNIARMVKIDTDVFLNKAVGLYYKIYPFYSLIYIVVFFSQTYLYWRAGKYLLKGVDFTDESAFNESFAILYRNAVLGIVGLAFSLVVYTFDLYLFIKYF